MKHTVLKRHEMILTCSEVLGYLFCNKHDPSPAVDSSVTPTGVMQLGLSNSHVPCSASPASQPSDQPAVYTVFYRQTKLAMNAIN